MSATPNDMSWAENTSEVTKSAATALCYPVTHSEARVEEQFGIAVADPFRWLENDIRADSNVANWVSSQNALTESYLSSLPRREELKSRLSELWNFERFSVPVKRGERYFFSKNSGLQNQASLYVQEGKSPARLLIDPNQLSVDGTVALANACASPDGGYLAFSLQEGGSDWSVIKVLCVDTGEILGEELKWIKFSNISWAGDGSGFFYSRFPEPEAGQEHQSPNIDQAVYFHKLRTRQSIDKEIYATPNEPSLGHSASVSHDGRWLVITTYEGTDDRYEIAVQDLSDAEASPRILFKGLINSWRFVASESADLIFVTDADAPRYRIVRVSAAAASATLKEVVAEAPGTIDNAAVVGDTLVVGYLEDAKSVLRSFGLDGVPKGSVQLPGIGTASTVVGSPDDAEGFFSFSSFATPPTIFRYDSTTGQADIFRASDLLFDPETYVVEQHFFRSRDGTQVPMFLVYQRELNLDGGVPTLLYGYGGFNISLPPSFSVARMAWLEMGGVIAVANIRGGGEYGKPWHDGGRLRNKQNSFDDFIAAAEFLIDKGVTVPNKLAIQGGSNGGMLIGAVVNQRPDLFGAALPSVGVMDMMRFNQFTAGRYWVDDYGDPSDESFFSILHAYSPYHNVKGGDHDYPAILVTTAETDDRVVPGHSFKYAAALQAADLGPQPHLIRVETRAGHGAGKPVEKLIAEAADNWAFAGFHTGLTTSTAKVRDGSSQ